MAYQYIGQYFERTGMWRIDEGEHIKIKKHGCPERSSFRHGLDKLQTFY
ncbi:MAG: hypothetical protein OXD32_02405 [Endozoicomonadaceae bacterium]|nr:hypothetical protein [Endozoicomonadaceae bacterium]MCY4329816.1 hypothetical protein [Endozoicomonadaceae bacterium]